MGARHGPFEDGNDRDEDDVVFPWKKDRSSAQLQRTMAFHTAAVCAWSRSNRRRNFDRVTAMERQVRKTA